MTCQYAVHNKPYLHVPESPRTQKQPDRRPALKLNERKTRKVKDRPRENTDTRHDVLQCCAP